jgi:hypothetical protein
VKNWKAISRVLIFVAVSCLILNDSLRFSISLSQAQIFSRFFDNSSEEEQKEASWPFSAEEEAKIKECFNCTDVAGVVFLKLGISIKHRIEDEEVRHLAHLSVFSPPPDLSFPV